MGKIYVSTVFAQKRHRLCTPKTEKRGFTCSTKIRIVQCINKQATHNMCFLKEERSIFDVKKTAPKNNQHKRNNRSLKFDHFCLQNQVTHALDGLSTSVTRRNNFNAQKKVNELNDALENLCLDESFIFIKNNNIIKDDICEDNLHLSFSGVCKLANNFIDAINLNLY